MRVGIPGVENKWCVISGFVGFLTFFVVNIVIFISSILQASLTKNEHFQKKIRAVVWHVTLVAGEANLETPSVY